MLSNVKNNHWELSIFTEIDAVVSVDGEWMLFFGDYWSQSENAKSPRYAREITSAIFPEGQPKLPAACQTRTAVQAA